MIINDYSRLLAFRKFLFPEFDTHQKRASERISDEIVRYVRSGVITTIVDVGCGTGEMLEHVGAHLKNSCPNAQLQLFGLDCCKEEIERAKKRRVEKCAFYCCRAEEMAALNLPVDWGKTLLMCVGHTLPHFDDIDAFFGALEKCQHPKFVLMDFYQGWDDVVPPLKNGTEWQIQEPRRIGPTNEVYILTTKCQAEGEDGGRVLRGVEVLRRESRDPEELFWTSQLLEKSDWFRTRFEDRGYIPEKQFEYHAGYGPMSAYLFSRPSRVAMDVNAVYQSVVARSLSEIFKKDSLKEAMGLFGTRVAAVIHPFDAHHTFAQYASIVENVDAPKDILYVAEPENIQTKYPTAYGLYMTLLNEVSSSTVIPLGELNNANKTEIDDRFYLQQESPFFRESNPNPLPSSIHSLNNQAEDPSHSASADSFFVIPFYFADLPLFCVVVTFSQSLPVWTTDQGVYSSVIQNVARLVRQELRSSFEGKVFMPFFHQATTELMAKHGHSASQAVSTLSALIEDAQQKKRWKSWLLTIPSRSIRGLALVEEEREELNRILAKAKRSVHADTITRIADWFQSGKFFDGQREESGKVSDEYHKDFHEDEHPKRLMAMLDEVKAGKPSDLLDSEFFGPPDTVKTELRWLVKQLESLLGKGSDRNAVFHDLKSVLCRKEANLGREFRFTPRRICTLCRIYQPDVEMKSAALTDNTSSGVPMAADHTMTVINVVRRLHTNSVKEIVLDWDEGEVQPGRDDSTYTVLKTYNLQVVMNSQFDPRGGKGFDYSVLKQALTAIGWNPAEDIPSFNTLRVQFKLREELTKDKGRLLDYEWIFDQGKIPGRVELI